MASPVPDNELPTRMPVPPVSVLKRWLDNKSAPDGTQMSMLSYAFDLSPKQEQKMWKMLQGKPLTLLQVMQSVRRGHSGAAAFMLIQASGFTYERLGEILGAPYNTISSWADLQSPKISSDVELAGKFAKFMTQCLDEAGGELKSWQLSSIQRDIISLLTGKDLEKQPSSAKDAAGRFQLILEEEFEKLQAAAEPEAHKNAFSIFINHILDSWAVNANYLNFINENNGSKEGDDNHISKYSFYAWANGEQKPHDLLMRKVISGTFINQDQELKLWKLAHGNRITADEIKNHVTVGNSGTLIKNLIGATGISANRLLEMIGRKTGNFLEWVDEDHPKKIQEVVQARRLADIALAHVIWDEMPPPPEEVEALKKSVVDVMTGRTFSKTLGDIVLEALESEDPPGHMVQQLTARMKSQTNADIAQTIGVTPVVLSHMKYGLRKSVPRLCSEDEAIMLVNEAGGGDKDTTLMAVDVLTQTRSPAQLLNLAEKGELWVGSISSEIRKRRHLRREDVQSTFGLSKGIIERFEDILRPRPVADMENVGRFAEFIGFTGDERRRFAIMASGQTLDPIDVIMADAESHRCSVQDALRRMCQQTAMPLEKTAEAIGLPAQQLSGYCKGDEPTLSFPKAALDKLGGLFGLAKDSAGMKKLQKLYIPDAARIMEMVETQQMERSEGLKHLFILADITPDYLVKEHQLPEAVATDTDALLKDKRLIPIFSVMAEKLQLNKTEAEVMDFIFNPERGHTKQNFGKHIKQYRNEVIGGILGEVVKQKQEWETLTRDSEPYLKLFDEFAQRVPTSAQNSLKTARALLTGQLGTSDVGAMIIDHAFRIVAKHIVVATPPKKDIKNGEWRGNIFDAVNKLLFQRSWACKERIGIPKLAETAEEARQQKKLLLADPEGSMILAAVIATNSGGIAQAAIGKLKDLPKYANNQELMMTDLWIGAESSDDDKVFVGGVLDTFPRWNPAGARYSTFAINMAKWRATHLYNAAKEEGTIDGHAVISDTTQAHDEEGDNVSSNIDTVSLQRYNHERRLDRDDPEEVTDTLSKVRMALDMLPDTEMKLLTAIFEGFMDGRAPMLHELIPVISKKAEGLTKERVRQKRLDAYTHFLDAWKVVAPDEPMPVGLERFIERMKERDNDTYTGRF